MKLGDFFIFTVSTLAFLAVCGDELVEQEPQDPSVCVSEWGYGVASCADTVVEAPSAADSDFGDPNLAVNGVRGGGDSSSGTDVFSLSLEPGVSDYLTLSWSGLRVTNGSGADFVVFENAFQVSSGAYFMDPTLVLLSQDGTNWIEFPHDYVNEDETTYSSDPDMWIGFAGIEPVRLNVDTNPVDPFDQELAGGDPFDLDDLPTSGELSLSIRQDGFRFLRLVAAATQTNPDTGHLFPADSMSNGPDIDGVYARYLSE